ncbi:MAG: hypothetical protein D6722_04415, partial [Bacteroidetes bacterium]
MRQSVRLLLPLLLLLAACDRGELLDNLPPETRIFVDEINLSGPNRLNSVVRLHWLGEDQDGYVTGYQLSLDGTNWSFTTRTDSTFRFDLNPGSDTTDIDFYVRAIDNLEALDPDPAYLRIPIRNTPPTARFDTVNVLPDTTGLVWSLSWEVDDLDGFSTLDSVFIRINDGPWYTIRPEENFASFLAEDPTQAGEQPLIPYLGLLSQPAQTPMQGVRVEGLNRMYLQARDIAGTLSLIDSTKAFYLPRQGGNLLVIDAHGDAVADEVYFPILDDIYPQYDYLDLLNNLPAYWSPTFSLLLQQYDKVFWYGDDAQIVALGQQLLLETAATSLQEYLNAGGKLFVTAKFPGPNTFDDPQDINRSAIFDFSPMDSLSTAPGQARIRQDTLVRPTATFAGNYPELQVSTNITGADPFYPKDPDNGMYTVALTTVGGWSGPNTVCAKAIYINGETNQVFWSLELHKLNAAVGGLKSMM